MKKLIFILAFAFAFCTQAGVRNIDGIPVLSVPRAPTVGDFLIYTNGDWQPVNASTISGGGGGGGTSVLVNGASVSNPNFDGTQFATSASTNVQIKTSAVISPRITLRVATLTDAATVTPDIDSYDGGKLLTLSQNTTIENPTGTPTPFQRFTIRIKSTTSRTLTFGAQFRGSVDLPIPAATSGASLTDYLGFVWNADDSKWDLAAKNFGF